MWSVRREARRLIDVNQAFTDRWLNIAPDDAVPHSRPASALSRTAVERRIGLYPTLDAEDDVHTTV